MLSPIRDDSAKEKAEPMEMYSDITLRCRDCGSDFVFTAGEQGFYAEKGFTNQPTRCPSCRQANKARRDSSMSYGGGGSYSGSPRAERQMFPVVCDECGQDTMVPFQPTGNKPVYCSDCFSARRSSYSPY